jgi:E3 ubiquitin-protein ligase RNF5
MSQDQPSATNVTNSSNSEDIEPNPTKDDNPKKEENSIRFECNICLDVPKDAVVSMCGHLFCWPCLHKWLETRPNRQNCPVCKSGLDRDKVVPIYGRDSGNTDPRDKTPPRPRGQRSEEDSHGSHGFHWTGDGGHGGVQFSLGIGFFPISFFANFFNNNNAANTAEQNENAEQGSRQHADEQFLSNVFMSLGILIILWLIFI